MNLNDIEKLTIESGEDWGISHVRRVLGLIDVIGEGLAYHREALQFAVYLHDWGAFPNYRRAGVDHALRSRQIAEEILPQTDFPADAIPIIVEAIELHDYRCTRPVRSTVALLLREALAGFIAVAVGIMGQSAWWRTLAIGASVVSLVALVLFVDRHPTQPAISAGLFDVAVLVALLVLRWPTSAIVGP